MGSKTILGVMSGAPSRGNHDGLLLYAIGLHLRISGGEIMNCAWCGGPITVKEDLSKICVQCGAKQS